MILTSLHVAGFGRLVDRHFDFAAGLNVVFGPNESGKSTLANAIVATLYGAERKKDTWRPWSGAPFATTLVYHLAAGDRIEVQRDFERDSKGLRVYDRDGNEISAQLGGAKLVPGEAHLGVPLDVFLNAACVRQQAIAIEEGRASGPIAAHLARALDGGPREDAALGAIARLEDALRTHVGGSRSRKNAPLRTLQTLAEQQRTSAIEARESLAALDELRGGLERAAHEVERLTSGAAELDRRVRALRAGAIAKRLANLRTFRSELAELQADYATYDDVAQSATHDEREIEEAFHFCQATARDAELARTEAHAARPSDADRDELERCSQLGGSLDDAAFATLSNAQEHVARARAAVETTAREAAEVRSVNEAATARNGWLVATLVALCVAIGCAIAHDWTWTALSGALAAAGLITAGTLHQAHSRRERTARERQRTADNALDAYTAAAVKVRAVLAPLHIESFADLVAQRARRAQLVEGTQRFERGQERARTARLRADTAAAHFDRLARAIVPAFEGNRAAHYAAVRARAARGRERDGIGAHLHALEMRKLTILGSDDEYGLELELTELQHDGVEPADDDATGLLRAVERERAAVAQALRTARDEHARLEGQLTGAAARAVDLAELDEQLTQTNAEIERLESFERAVRLAKSTLEARTAEAHRAFARRLEDYAAAGLSTVTAGRYAEIFVDPATFTIRVRVPETRAIAGLDALSAGTRDQTYLVVRLAMARMFAQGLETPPLLLDDPFAYWDDARIERCLPIVEYHTRDAQAVLFTSSAELANAACRRGAHRFDLAAPGAIEPAHEASDPLSVRSTAIRV